MFSNLTFTKTIFLTFLVFTLLFAFVACGEEEVVVTTTSSSPHATNANNNVKTKNVKKIVLVKVKFENNFFSLIIC